MPAKCLLLISIMMTASTQALSAPRCGEIFRPASSDPGVRQALVELEKFFHDIALEMINDRVIIPLVSPNVVLAHAKSVKGVRYSACCNLPLDEITRE